MNQVITEPTHNLENSSSCIDLIFSNQLNFIMDSGVHPTLHSKCHHQIIYSKLNLKIEYPPSYTRKIWNYSRSETDLINCSIKNFDWSKLLSGKNVHEQVELFNKRLLNISTILFQTEPLYAMTGTLLGWMMRSKKWLREKIGYFRVKECLVSLILQF